MKKMFIIFAQALLALCTLAACDSTYVGLEGKTVEFKVTGITPASAPSGTVVEITGTGFSRDASQMKVLFGNKSAKVLTSSLESMSVVAPENGLGEVVVYVLKDNKSVTTKFMYSKADAYVDYPQTPVGRTLEEKCNHVSVVMWDTTYVVTPGLEFTELTLRTADDERQQLHLLKMQPDMGLRMRVCLPNNSTSVSNGWKKQTLTSMTTYLNKAGNDVIAMINADFWNMDDINPRGPVHMDGKIVSDAWDYSDSFKQQALSFVGVSKDGKPVIDYREAYGSYKADLVDCTGGGIIMLKDGVIPDISYAARDPRTAVGFTPDGTWWLLTAAGRDYDKAAGLRYDEMGAMFQTLGCEAALNLDGGGSAQMLIKNPATGKYQIINNPTDGKERAVINGWAIIKK